MKRNHIIILISTIAIYIVSELIIKIGGYDYFSGVGLVVLIIYAVMLYTIMKLFLPKKFPKNEKEMKEFRWEGIFNPLFGAIVFSIGAILSAISLIFGPKTTYNAIATVVMWAVAIFFIYFWLKMKKLGLVGKKK